MNQRDLEVAIDRQSQMVEWAKSSVAQAQEQNKYQADELRKIRVRVKFLELVKITNVPSHSKAELDDAGTFLLNVEKGRLQAVEDAVKSTNSQMTKVLDEIRIDEVILESLLEAAKKL